MPLHKPPPKSNSNAKPNAPLNPHLPRHHRRTLQTISELSATDTTSLAFPSLTTTKHHGQIHLANSHIVEHTPRRLDKRRSLPQYCSSPEYLQVQALRTAPAVQLPTLQRSRSARDVVDSGPRGEEGWNTGRERARRQGEPVVGGGDEGRDVTSERQGRREAVGTTHLPGKRSSQKDGGAYASHQQGLRHRGSTVGVPQRNSRRASDGSAMAYGNHGNHGDHDVEASERASADSSSYRSMHNSAVRRSRSGSSGQSAHSQMARPMPVASPPLMQRYYSNGPYHGPTAGQLSLQMHARPSAGTTRSFSMPSVRGQRHSFPTQDRMLRIPSMCTLHAQQVDVQRARHESLAALTAAYEGQSSTMQRPPITKGIGTHRHSTSSYHSHSHSHSSLRLTHPPRPTYSTPSTTTPHLTTRALPTRETLTQWKLERDEAKTRVEEAQKAKVREQVRRANEMEQEREKELVMMRREVAVGGTAGVGEKMVVGKKEKGERGRGCFKGLLGILGLREA